MTASGAPLTTKIELGHEGFYTPADDTLHSQRNAGFFSNCSVALWNLSELHSRHGRQPSRLDFSKAFGSYRNAAQAAAATDLYPLFFAPPDPTAVKAAPLPQIPWINHHGLYRFLDYGAIGPALARYFQPSARALALEAELIARHGIDLAKTIAVVYRGTDKGIEVKLAAPQAYLEQARKLLAANPGHRVLIQTDELRVRELFMNELGSRCFFLPEMPVSTSAAVVHDLDDAALRLDRSEFGLLLVAVTHLLSRCDLIVNHTGNMALWICLYRGHGKRVVQFDEAGALVDFSSPRFYARRMAWLFGKVWRKLAR
jgi:hypothetical protein